MAVLLGGCVTINDALQPPWVKQVRENRANMFSLKIGMSKTEVISLMGQPFKNEAYETKTGSIMEYLMYRTDADVDSSGWSDKEMTPLCLIDDKLKGWGRNFYDDTIKIRKEVIKKDN